MNRHDQFMATCLRSALLVLVLALAAVPVLAQTSSPAVVSRQGYINGTPLAAHTTGAVNSTNASLLVAFVSTHPSWLDVPVSISGLSDNLGNTWNVLVGPTTWTGSAYTLMSAIYYVTAPVTGDPHTITVNLTNPAPLVVHVFAVSGSDTTGPPIYSFITAPGPGPSADVISQAITVPSDTLLLAWAKNENGATATAQDGWTLDRASTSFLWAEYQTAVSAGTYDGHFVYSNSIGWQTAIVGVTPAPPGPAAQSQSVTTNHDTPVNITLTAVSPDHFPLTYTVLTQPAHGQLSGAAPQLTYTPVGGYSGNDSFTFKANDGTGDSNVAVVSITVRPPNQPPVAHDGTVTVGAGTTVAIDLSAGDPDGDPLAYTVLTSPAHGLLSGTAPNLTYAPNAGYVGGDSFTFTANDGTADSNVAQIDISVTAVVRTPAVVSRQGYINGTPLAAHTTGAVNSTNASLLVAFVSTHPSWLDVPVSISGLSDNLGNTWNVLVGPTTWTGSAYTLMSAIYYVTAPVTGDPHTITVNLTNPAPLVVHVFAVSGSDTTGPPIYSFITAPGPGPSADVISQAITVPSDTLLLAWAKNENGATATAQDGWTLDRASTSFLWAEYQTAVSAGTYDGHFVYSNSIGWQTAIVGATTAPLAPVNHAPDASNSSATTNQNVPVTGGLVATDVDGDALAFSIVTNGTKGTATITNATTGAFTYTPLPNVNGADTFTFKANDGLLDSNVATVTLTITLANHAPDASNSSATTDQDVPVTGNFVATDVDGDALTFSIVTNGAKGAATLTNATTGAFTYTPLANVNGTDTFTFKANDGLLDSNVATVTVTITPDTTPPPDATIASGPRSPTSQTSATFVFGDSEAGATLLCDLDGSGFSVCTSPQSYPGPLGQGAHVFSVKARDAAGNESNPVSFSWTVDLTPPDTFLDSRPVDPSGSPSATFAFHAAKPGSTLECNLDGAGFAACTSPAAYTGLADGSHTFQVRATDAAGNADPTPASFSWTIDTLAPDTTIDSSPANPTTSNTPTFSFHASEGSSFECSLDGSDFTACMSPTSYSGLADGSHAFQVRAIDAAGNQSTGASFTWIVDSIAPPTPTITSTPGNPTTQTGASFSFGDTEAGVSFLCQLDGSFFSSCASPEAYSGPLTQGSHTFSVKAQDAAGNQSAAATFTWIVDTTAPPTPTITSTPGNPTTQTSASFSFSDTEAGVSFLCQLDGGAFSSCASPKAYSGPLTQGSHTFSVKAQDAAGNQSAAATFTWIVDTTAPPTPTITSTPGNPTTQTGASFSFSDTEAGVSFLCQLDGGAFSSCASPKAYSGPLTQGSHTFSVKAQDAAGNQSAGASFTWTIDTTAPPAPTITSTPAQLTNQTSATFSFLDTEAGVSFLCQLDGSGFSACSSPKTYPGLSQGSHTFSVKARDAAGNQSGPVSYAWSVDTTSPPTPTITSTPAKSTKQTSATFKFTDSEASVSFLCQLDSGGFSACSSPEAYSRLSQGSHTFSVKAQDAAGNQSAAATFAWSVTR